MMKRCFLLLFVPPLLLGACGTDVAGPSATLYACVFEEPLALAPGEVLQVSGEEHLDVCLEPGDAGGTFLYVPFYATAAGTDSEVSITLELTGAGFGGTVDVAADRLPGPGVGPVSASIAGQDVQIPPPHAFHDRLRRREIDELEPKIRPGGAPLPAPRRAAATTYPAAVGEVVDYNVAISCEGQNIRQGQVEYVSEHAVVVADVGNPVRLPAADYQHIGESFDTLVHPVVTAHFGEPTDIDANERVVIFFTRAVNQLTASGSEAVTVGFFWSGDLFPAEETDRLEACPGGNEAEMFYMVSPDPAGDFGPQITAERVMSLAVGILGHELQHLINAARRMYVNQATKFERPWLNEGLSHIAEELLFYDVTGLEPGRNLDASDLQNTTSGVWAYNRYVAPNFSNLTRYLSQPDTASLMGVDGLTTRGATWAFLRYAADRSARGDNAFFFDLVNSTEAGLDNLDEVVGDSALRWMQDWTVAVFADDAIPGVAPRFTQPSWNFRAVYQATSVGAYPLDLIPLSSGAPREIELLAGGAAFPVFGVGAGGRAALHVDAGGAPLTRALRGSFLRIQ